MRVYFSRQFALFMLTGGTAALVNFGSRLVFDYWFTYSTSIILAYLVGMVTAYLLARVFVFPGSTKRIRSSVLAFTVVNAVAVAQTWAISMLLAYYLLPSIGVTVWVPEISHAVGIAAPVFTSFLGHKYWSFR